MAANRKQRREEAKQAAAVPVGQTPILDAAKLAPPDEKDAIHAFTYERHEGGPIRLTSLELVEARRRGVIGGSDHLPTRSSLVEFLNSVRQPLTAASAA